MPASRRGGSVHPHSLDGPRSWPAAALGRHPHGPQRCCNVLHAHSNPQGHICWPLPSLGATPPVSARTAPSPCTARGAEWRPRVPSRHAPAPPSGGLPSHCLTVKVVRPTNSVECRGRTRNVTQRTVLLPVVRGALVRTLLQHLAPGGGPAAWQLHAHQKRKVLLNLLLRCNSSGSCHTLIRKHGAGVLCLQAILSRV